MVGLKEVAIVESDVRIVSFMGDQRGLCEDLYRCKETGRVFIRQECDDTHVRWLTASKWREGYEADCHLREGLTLRAVDKSSSRPKLAEGVSALVSLIVIARLFDIGRAGHPLPKFKPPHPVPPPQNQ